MLSSVRMLRLLMPAVQYIEGPKAEQPAAAAGSDISALIAEEVADIKSGTNQPLTWHKTNITGLLYLALDDSAGKHHVLDINFVPGRSAAVSSAFETSCHAARHRPLRLNGTRCWSADRKSVPAQV